MESKINLNKQVEENKAILNEMLKDLSKGDISGFTDHLAPNYVRHCQAMPPGLQEINGKDTMYQWLLSNQKTFPDYQEKIEFLIGEGEFVAWRSKGTGTQRGALGPFPPTNKRMEITIIGMHHFKEGLIVETWTSWDNLAALMQLGLMPGT